MNIVLTGSIAFDYLMTFPGHFRDHILPDHLDSISLSFLVESLVRLRGGVAPNIAYTMAMLGDRPTLFATVGEDFEEYRLWLENQGVDTRYARVVPGEYTASFFANTDRSNAQIASFYPGAMAHAAALSLRELDQQPDYVMISPNDPQAMNKYVAECQELDLPYFYDPSQQIVRMTEEELYQGIIRARGLFVNEYEYALIEKAIGLKPKEIMENACFMVVTEGENGASIYAGGQTIHVPSVPPMQVVDPTGVGDAFRGGFLIGFGRGFDLETCGQIGALAATYCLEHRGPQGHYYTPQEFVARFREHFDDQGKLDAFIR